MTQAGDKPRRSQRAAIILTVVAGVIATAVAYMGTRENPWASRSPSAATTGDASLSVPTIILPQDEVELPPGPHQRAFAVNCTICHSPRLVMTQPPFSRKQWTEVVHKMVKTYGAPIAPETEEQIVDYLTAVRGR